jgi:hypothetical protein
MKLTCRDLAGVAFLTLPLLVVQGGCDSKPPAAGLPATSSSAAVSIPPSAAPRGEAGARQRLLGSWTFEASPQTKKKMVEQFKQRIRDPKKADDLVRRFEEGLANMTLEITPQAMVTRQGSEEVGRDTYDVVSEDGPRITVRMVRANKEQAMLFQDERTVLLKDDQMGEVTLRRK